MSAEQEWNPFQRDISFDDEFDKLHLDNQSRDTLLNSEDVFSSAPFSLPGEMNNLQSGEINNLQLG